jgi:predicted ArsR family transcriptional regulator
MNSSQHSLLNCLKTRGPQSVRRLATFLSITPMGIRQHLAELAEAGLVEPGEQRKQKRGRPLRLWQLSEAGHARFPDHHDLLASDLLTQLHSSLGASATEQLAKSVQLDRLPAQQHRLQELINTQTAAPLPNALPAEAAEFKQRLQALVTLRQEQGYMAELRLLPDGWLLVQNHCPIKHAALSSPGFCSAEIDLLQALLGPQATVERRDHLIAGARRCTFRVALADRVTRHDTLTADAATEAA